MKWTTCHCPAKQRIAGHLEAATTETMISCSLVVIILAVIPWRSAWRTYVRAPGE